MEKIIIENSIRHTYTVKTEEFKTIGFKFGMSTWYVFSKKAGIGLMDLQAKLKEADLGVMLELFHASHEAYQIKKKKPVELTIYDMGDIIDEIGMEAAGKLLELGMKSFGEEDAKKKV